jgi:hypothetical protein
MNMPTKLFLSIYDSTALSWALGAFQFMDKYTVGRTPCTGDQLVARPLPIHRTTQLQNKRIQTSMPRLGFESTTPVFERAKTVHALDHAVTVIGLQMYYFDITVQNNGKVGRS